MVKKLIAFSSLFISTSISFAQERRPSQPTSPSTESSNAEIRKYLRSEDPEIRKAAAELLSRLEKSRAQQTWTLVDDGKDGAIRLRPTSPSSDGVLELVITKNPEGKWMVQEVAERRIRLPMQIQVQPGANPVPKVRTIPEDRIDLREKKEEKKEERKSSDGSESRSSEHELRERLAKESVAQPALRRWTQSMNEFRAETNSIDTATDVRLRKLEQANIQLMEKVNALSTKLNRSEKKTSIEEQNIHEIAKNFEVMDPEMAADQFSKMIEGGKIDVVVQIMSRLPPRTSARIMSQIQIHEYAIQVLDALQKKKLLK